MKCKILFAPNWLIKLNLLQCFKSSYVDRPEDYIYSSYRAYYSDNREIILPITILDFGSEEGFIFAAG